MSNYSRFIEDYEVSHGVYITGTVWFWEYNEFGADISSIDLQAHDDSVVEINSQTENALHKEMFNVACEKLGADADFQEWAYEAYRDNRPHYASGH